MPDYPCGAPDKEDIERLVKAAFYSSIEREEGAFITFSLMFLQTHKESRPRHRLSEMNCFLAFEAPIKLSVQAIRKLAGAIDERTSSLVVENRAGGLVLTGVAPFGRQTSRFTAAVGCYPRPEALTISVRAPGSLLLSRAHSNLGRFVAGEFQAAQITPFHSQALGERLITCISQHEAFARFGNSYWHWYRDALEHLLCSTSGRGHGGLIVWLPKSERTAACQHTRFGVPVRPFTVTYAAFLDLLTRSKAFEQDFHAMVQARGDAERSIVEKLLSLSMDIPSLKYRTTTLFNTLAQLGCIDGAILIDDYFEPVSFGARLTAREWEGPVRLGPTAAAGPGDTVPRGRFGTRHNSAIDFVAAVPGSIAFVLSQDGPVRAVTNIDDTIFLWPDCLNTMFVD